MSGTVMEAEIAQAGAAARRQLALNARATDEAARRLRALKPAFVVTIARGSSDHAALFLKYAVEIRLGLACASLGPSIASLYRAPLRLGGAVAVTISQSGRSPDIVAMQRAAKDAGATTVALVNDVQSPVADRGGRAAAAARGPGTFGRRDQVDDRLAGRRRLARRALGRGRRADSPRSTGCRQSSKPHAITRRKRRSRRSPGARRSS